MDLYTSEVLKYYCDEKKIKFDESLVNDEDFSVYFNQWVERSKRKSELRLEEFQNKLVKFYQKIENYARKKIKVEIGVSHGEKKRVEREIKGYLKAKKCHKKLSPYIKIVVSEDK